MHAARQPKRQSTTHRPKPSAPRSTEPRAFACEALEPRWLLSGSGVYDTLDPQAEAALVSTELGEPVAYPRAVLASNEEANPLAGSASPGGFTPQQMRHAYGFDQIFFDGGTIVGDGTGQTIAIVNAFHTPTAAADLAAFSAYFGLPAAPSFVQVDQNGGTNYPTTDAGWALETALDVQWAHAFAPGADILLVEAASAGFSDLMTAIDYARNQPDVSIVSLSWGTSGEFSSETSYDFHFTTPAGHEGITFFAAAGNSGGPGGYPAYSPNVVAVGGTTLSLNGSGNIASESAWSGSGGGISQYEAQPVWQNGVVTQTSTKRAMPDVAFDANPSTGVPVYDTFNNSASTPWTKVAGTSFATPSWGALVAIANQGRELAGLSSFDITGLLTSLYTMPTTNFNDITTGSSSGTSPQSAAPGYDLVTGLGTPKAQRVVASLVGTSSVTGVVFEDSNGNGANDDGPGLAGWTVYADLNGNAVFDAPSQSQFNSSDVPLAISTVGTSSILSDLVVSGLASNILDVNVTLNVSHTRTSDLAITLIAPDGTEVVLANHVGGTGDNFTGTTFDDSAATAIGSGTAPFSGSFHPSGSLADLLGDNPNGTWRLRVDDTVFFEGGSLNSWSLEITTGEPNTVTGADGTYVLDGLPAGTYEIRQVVQSPYVQTTPAGGYYTVNLSDGSSATGRNFGNQLLPTAAPTGVTLVPGSDSGVSNSDGITRLNNSGPAGVLDFQVSGTLAGATVTVLADGMPIGSAVAAGSTTIVTTNGTTTLADGVRSITARQTIPAQPTSADSPVLDITIDTAAPVASIVAVTPDPRSTPVAQITFNFNEVVSGLNAGALALTRDAGSNLLSGAQTLGTSDGLTWTLGNLSIITTAAGFYELLLNPALSSATDAAGNVAGGAQTSFTVTVAAVVDRLLFYNQSAFDNDDAGINAADDAAIAGDKVAYTADSGLAGPNSVSSYVRGINGIMVDIASPAGTITPDDFTFRIGANNSPGTWSVAPAPLAVSVRPGAGTDGADRVEIIWADGAITNTWLQVTVEGNDAAGGFNTNTGLAASDVFYFGNMIGETFDAGVPGFFVVDATDEIAARNHQGLALSVTNLYDLNRDASVDATDQILARMHQGFLAAIDVVNAPPVPAAAPSASPATDESPEGSPAEIAAQAVAPPPSTPARRASAGDIAFALATAYGQRELQESHISHDWLGAIDEQMLDLLGRARLARRR